MKSDSGVVTRMCGGAAAHAVALEGRGVARAHGVADRDVVDAQLEQLVADAGERLLEVLLDVVRERLQRRDVEDVDLVREPPARGPRRTKSLIAERKAASVLPEPVGAAIRALRCCEVTAQARDCASVGAGKRLRNQPATAGWKPERASGDIAAFWARWVAQVTSQGFVAQCHRKSVFKLFTFAINTAYKRYNAHMTTWTRPMPFRKHLSIQQLTIDCGPMSCCSCSPARWRVDSGHSRSARHDTPATRAACGRKPNTVRDLQAREATQTIQLNSLRELANAIDCDLVYALVPRKSLGAILEDRARTVARNTSQDESLDGARATGTRRAGAGAGDGTRGRATACGQSPQALGMSAAEPDGATPLDPDEARSLIPSHIATQAELNAWEHDNIVEGERWAFARRRKDFLTVDS